MVFIPLIRNFCRFLAYPEWARVLAQVSSPATPALLLLTATISPPDGMPALQRVDPAARRADYESALSFYLGLPSAVVNRIVLAENSDSELGSLERIAQAHGAGKDVELLSFAGHDFPAEHGRMVGELRTMETAFERSRLLSALGDDELFWKVTGRLRFTNMERLVATTPPGAALYADFRKLPRPWVDTRVYAATPQAFRELFATRIDLMRQGEIDGLGYTAPEHRLFEELMSERARFTIVPRLRAEPRIEGFSGHGHDYARPTRRLWTSARAVIRRLFPPLWI